MRPIRLLLAPVTIALLLGAMLAIPDTAQGMVLVPDHKYPVADFKCDGYPLALSAIDVRAVVSWAGISAWSVAFNVQNIAAQDVIAYDVLWTVYNAFDEPIETVVYHGEKVVAGQKPAGICHDFYGEGCRSLRLHDEGMRVTVAIPRVRFADGTIWTAPTPTSAP